MTDFANIARHYDNMTGYSSRLINDFGRIKNLTEKFKIKDALDAGCGTGVHTIILGKLGIDVKGLDASKEMLAIARTNAFKEGQDPEFKQGYLESLPRSWGKKFDTVFCLANTIVGVESGERLAQAYKSFYRVLKPGGRAIIQVLNFAHFRRENRRIIKVSSTDNFTYVRFLDFGEEETRLNVLIIEHDMGQVKHELISETILPLSVDALKIAAKAARFSRYEFYSDLTVTEAFREDCDNIVMVAHK